MPKYCEKLQAWEIKEEEEIQNAYSHSEWHILTSQMAHLNQHFFYWGKKIIPFRYNIDDT